MPLRLLHAGPVERRWLAKSCSGAGGLAGPLAALDFTAGEAASLVSTDAEFREPVHPEWGGVILQEAERAERTRRIGGTFAGYLAGGPNRLAFGVANLAEESDPWLVAYDRRPDEERVPRVSWGGCLNFFLVGPQGPPRVAELIRQSGFYPSVAFLASDAGVVDLARGGGAGVEERLVASVDFVLAKIFDEESWLLWARPGLALPAAFASVS